MARYDYMILKFEKRENCRVLLDKKFEWGPNFRMICLNVKANQRARTAVDLDQQIYMDENKTQTLGSVNFSHVLLLTFTKQFMRLFINRIAYLVKVNVWCRSYQASKKLMNIRYLIGVTADCRALAICS